MQRALGFERTILKEQLKKLVNNKTYGENYV